MVTSTRAEPRVIRDLIGSGPKAENSGQNTLPAFSVPRAATYSSGTRPASANTRSPFPTPRLLRALANRLVRVRSSA